MPLLHLEPTGTELDAESLGFVEFFNAAHSVEAIIDGVKLAVWCSTPPLRWAIEGAGPIAWFGWLESGHLNTARVPIAYVDEHPDVLRGLRYVVLATPELEQGAPATWRRLLEAGYQPRLPRQVTGWYLDEDVVTAGKPSHRPSLALLAEQGSAGWQTSRCLVLVEVNYVWKVLSERGASTYSHGSRLMRGDAIRFLAEDETHPVELVRVDSLAPERLEAEFGPGLLDPDAGVLGLPRARDDVAALVVRMRRT